MPAFRRIRIFRTFPAEDKLLFVQAMFLLPLVDIALRLAGYSRCYRWLGRWAEAPTGAIERRPNPSRAAWLVERAAHNFLWPTTCLRRSLVLWALLVRSGVRTELRIGFRKPEGRFEAHAWLEWNGVPLNEKPDVRERYSVANQPLTRA
jgi:hypothetical protein